ncbi:MAG: fumarylacetoacetate hydrolase family protein [Arenicellales bacterium]
MKLATFKTDGTHAAPTWGVVREGVLLDLPAVARMLGQHLDCSFLTGIDSVRKLLQVPDGLSRLRELLDRIDEQAPPDALRQLEAGISGAQLYPPVPDAGKFLCVGKNYRAHLEELKRNDLLKEQPAEPTGFIKLTQTMVGHCARVARPEGITTLDYEPELAFVIGSPGFRISRENAMRHVAGITLFNDLTAREIQKREVASGTRFWTAKNMPGFGPVGPFLVTMDEISDPHDLWLTLSVNGEQRIRVNTGDQIFHIPDIIEHFSRYLPLDAGDQFSTGAPGGVAVGQPNAEELYLKPGDTVEVGIEGIAKLTTYIV